MSKVRFAVIGIDHRHIFGQVGPLLAAGAELACYHAEGFLLGWFKEKYPHVPAVDDRRRILDDKTIQLIVSAGVPSERAALGIEAMRHGKDFMADKPGVTSFEQLAAVRKVQAETGRIFSVCYSEHFETRATVKAGELIKAGAIGRVLHTAGLGPHRLNKKTRPEWFFQRDKYGGILTDIGSHQCEQFLFLTGADDAEVVAASVANRANADTPGLQDFGEMLLRTSEASGYICVHWFTPDGLPTWGDGRLFITGTQGAIELRKYVDIGGAPGIDHVILVDNKGVQRIDCSAVRLPYSGALIHDILTREETAMPQARCFKAAELALTAQAMAERGRT
jgi:predicted dehydrogenase